MNKKFQMKIEYSAWDGEYVRIRLENGNLPAGINMIPTRKDLISLRDNINFFLDKEDALIKDIITP